MRPGAGPMRPGAAFAGLFGAVAVVLLIAAVWTSTAASLSGKLFATALLIGCAGVIAFLADRGEGDGDA